MIALLRANPDAFIGGNITPGSHRCGAADAGRRHAGAGRRGRGRHARARRRPASGARPPRRCRSRRMATNDSRCTAPAPAARSARTRPHARPMRVWKSFRPAPAMRSMAGTQSGISAGGEGDMLRQELTDHRKRSPRATPRWPRMKSRVAELEKLQQQQQQLIAMKDTRTGGRAAAPGQTQSNDTQAPMSATPWLVGGGAVLLVALLGWWLGRRRAATRYSARRPSAPPAIADAFASGATGAPVARADDSARPRRPADLSTLSIPVPSRTRRRRLLLLRRLSPRRQPPPTSLHRWSNIALIRPTSRHRHGSRSSGSGSRRLGTPRTRPAAWRSRTHLARRKPRACLAGGCGFRP